MRRLLREQDQVGAAPIALTISRDANTGAGQDPHRPGCGGSTPPSCRDWVASIAAMLWKVGFYTERLEAAQRLRAETYDELAITRGLPGSAAGHRLA